MKPGPDDTLLHAELVGVVVSLLLTVPAILAIHHFAGDYRVSFSGGYAISASLGYFSARRSYKKATAE